MKIFEYILKFGFMLLLSTSLILYVGPSFFKLAKSTSDISSLSQINKIEIKKAFSDDDYVSIEVRTTNGSVFRKNYYKPEDQHKKLNNFLIRNKLITNEVSNSNLPIVINTKTINGYENAAVKEENGVIKTLIINNEYIVGREIGTINMIGLYIIGVLFLIIGSTSFLLIISILIKNIKIYSNTGKLPNLPNSIDSKIEGIKFLFKRNKTGE